jgi:hypothetical protein
MGSAKILGSRTCNICRISCSRIYHFFTLEVKLQSQIIRRLVLKVILILVWTLRTLPACQSLPYGIGGQQGNMTFEAC